MVTGPYAEAADAYWRAGWRGVLPLPPRRKANPPNDRTGRAGVDPSRADVQAYVEACGTGNIALRLPANVVGIDVDAYGDKLGGETLAEREADWAELPTTWISTSRDDGISGIRFYRVPAGLAWPGEIGPGIEIVQRVHRYAVVAPSVHPNGSTYRWLAPAAADIAPAESPTLVGTSPLGSPPASPRFPSPDELPSLPDQWIKAITNGEADSAGDKVDLDAGAVSAWIRAHGAESPCAEMNYAVADYAPERFAGTAGRHPALTAATHRIVQLTREGHHGAIDALGIIRARFDAAVQADPNRPADPTEWARQLDGAVRLAAGAGAVAEVDPCAMNAVNMNAVNAVNTTVADAAMVELFWSSRPVLALIHSAARAALCSPWAVFGAVLARLITAVPKFIVLPSSVGKQASLNLFVALVGPSGGGKGASVAVASDLLDVGHIVTGSVGSGEGLAHMYARRVKSGVERVADAVLFDVAEVDTLTALGARQGATLLPELRKAFIGEALGFSYADPAKKLPIHKHDYRLCMIVGVQPGRAAGLLNDTDGGTPQRFLWLPTTDPDVPDLDEPAPVDTITWRPSDLEFGYANMAGLREITVPGAVRFQVRASRRAVLRGVGAALDGHALLTRLKVATALTLLDKRVNMTESDWELSGVVMGVSDATRAAVVATLATASAETNRRRGRADADRAVQSAEALDGRIVARVARRVGVNLAAVSPSWVSRRDVHRGIALRDRGVIPDALDVLLAAGQIEADTSEPDRPSYRAKGPAK